MPDRLTARDLEIIAAWSGHEPLQVAADPRLHEMGRMLVADALTGLYNRRYFMARVEAELAAGRRLAVAILDLDGFKQVNDRLGHDRGDAVLRACAAELEAGLPEAVVARLGGDEYAVLFCDLPVDAAAVILQPLLKSIPARVGELDLDRPLQFSAGLAAFPEDGSDVSALLRAADAAMYWAKRDPQRRVRVARDLGEVATAGHPRTAILAAPLTGRDELWQRLKELLSRAAAGHGRMVSLEGPPGVGKSRIMRELAGAAREAKWLTLWVQPGPAAGLHRPFDDVLAKLTGRVDTPLPGGRRPATLHRLVLAQVRRLLQAAAGGPPLLIALDDLHEADHATWTLLRALGPELGRRAVLLIATVRTADDAPDAAGASGPGSHGGGWAGLRAEGAAAGWLVPEALAGLDLAGTRTLVAALLGGPISHPAAGALHEATGGNPLHIIQVLKAWLSAGVLSPGPNGWTRRRDSTAEAPADLRAALFWRVGQLEPEAREVLGLGAVLGSQFGLRDLEALSGATPDELVARLDRALQAQMVVAEGPDGYRFAHPLLRDAAYGSLSVQARRLAHRVAGHLLQDSGAAPAAELARHFDAAGAARPAFDYHVRAGEEAAARFAHAAACHHFGRARQLMMPAGVSFDDWWTRLALWTAAAAQADGDPGAAAAVCQDALRHRSGLPPGEVLALLVQWGESARLAGKIPEAESAHREAEALAGPGTPDRDRLHVRALGLRLRYNRTMHQSNRDEALAMAAEAGRLGERVLEGAMYSLAGAVAIQLGRQDEAAELNARGLALLPVGSGPDSVLVRLRAGMVARTVPAARRLFQEALRAAAAVGDVLARARILRLLGNLERSAGRWAAARPYYEESLNLARRQGSDVERDRSMYELGTLLAWTGQTEEGIALASAAARAAVARGDRLTAASALGRLAFCLMAADRPQEAAEALAPVSAWLPPEHVVRHYLLLVRALAVLLSGDAGAAHQEAAPFCDSAMPFEGPALRAWVMGSIAAARGEAEGALAWLRQALRESGRPFVEDYWLAWAELEQALVLRRLGLGKEAERSFRRARAMFARMGTPGALAAAARRWAP